MKCGQSNMIVTLNADATNRMVRLLLATLNSEDREFEEKQQQQEDNE
jgi:hypothetical protein